MKFFDLIDQSVSKLSRIIGNLMSKARDQQNLNKELLNLGDLMEQELEFLLSNQFFKDKVEKKFSISKDVPVIYGLYSDFSQSFVNIIKNAIDAMWKSPVKKLDVSVHYEGDYILVKITDTGKGIPKEAGDKIFQPFFTTKPKYRDAAVNEPTGTGIGLDSVKTLLTPYGADISYVSEVGKGTEFTIKIPVSVNKKHS